MSTEQQQAAAEETPLSQVAGDATQDTTANTEAQTEGERADPAIERRARDLGWVPEAEWHGDPPKGGFRSAEEFIKRGEEVLPIVNKRLERELRQEREARERDKKDFADRVERLDKMSRMALQQQRSKIVEEFEAKQDVAAESGDVERVRALRKEQRETLAEFDKNAADDEPPKKKDDDKLPSHIKTAVQDWVAENSWFTSDDEMNAVANRHHERLLKEQPGLSITENLAKVREYVARRYPEKFGKSNDAEDEADTTARRNGSRVEGGARIAGGGGGSLWAKLPADAKAQADKFIKEDGLFLEKGETAEKNMTQARERYAREYLGESK